MMQPELPWAIYIRTSTFEQGEKSSPLKQFTANVTWAKNNGKSIPGIEAAIVSNKVQRGDYIFVDHQTGTNDDRPDLQRFMALARLGKVGGVICYVVDRAARNLSDAVKIHRDLKRMRVGFQFALQNFDDTPAGTLMFQIFAAFAEYEVKIIAERTHDGLRKRILGIGKKDGKPRVSGPPLYGYRLIDGVPIEDEQEGPVARFFLRRVLDTGEYSSRQIAKALNDAGHRSRTGKIWRDTTVSKLLRRVETYAGIYRHRHGIEAATKAYHEAVKLMGREAPPLDLAAIETIETAVYPPLITREEANLILARVEKNLSEKRGRPTIKYVLAHYLWCEVCKCRWYAKTGQYYCGCRDLKMPRCRAPRTMVAQAWMESAVLDGMRSYLKRPEVHYAVAIENYNANRGSSKRSREEIEKEVRGLAKEQAHYDEQATAYGLSPKQREIAKRKAEQLDRKTAELNAELRQLSVEPLPSQSGVAAAFGQILAILDRMATFDEKREFVEATIDRIVTDGMQVKITGAFDVRAIENKGSKGAIYPIRRQAAGFIKSSPIPFAFSASITNRKRVAA